MTKLTPAQRKAKQRKAAKDSGLVLLRFRDVWCTPEQNAILKMKIADLIAETVKISPSSDHPPEPQQT